MILRETEVRKNGIVLTVADDDQEETIVLSVDDFYAFHLHSGDEIGPDLLKEIKAAAEKSAIFAKCLNKLAAHDRSVKEMEDWLKDKAGASKELRNEIIAKLEQLGYLDDERYCHEQVSAMKSSLKGERAVLDSLRKKGIDEKMIRQVLDEYDDEEENAFRYGEKVLKGAQKGSLQKAKRDVANKLRLRGYDNELARKVAEQLDYSSLGDAQKDNVRNALAKAYKRYGRKYSGYELHSRLYRYGLQQGYSSETVNAVLNEMESEYEED